MVAARGINPVLNFALEEAQLRKAVLCVVYVKESCRLFFRGAHRRRAREMAGRSRSQRHHVVDAQEGQERGVCVLPVYAVSEDAAATILDLSATMGVDCLVSEVPQRGALTNLLRGSVANQHRTEFARFDSFGHLRLITYPVSYRREGLLILVKRNRS